MADDHISCAVEFKATLITRGGGTGAKRIMDQNPERGEYIKHFTGWNRVKAGTLTLDNAQPLPAVGLKDVTPLAIEPEGLLQHLEPRDAAIAMKRGAPAYFAGVARAHGRERRVILSQQPRPAVAHRLELIADVCLRDALHVADGDEVILAIFDPFQWKQKSRTDC